MAKPNDPRENNPDNRGSPPGAYSGSAENGRRTDEPIKGAGWNRGFETIGSQSPTSHDRGGTYYRAALSRSQQRGEGGGYGPNGPYGRHSPQSYQSEHGYPNAGYGEESGRYGSREGYGLGYSQSYGERGDSGAQSYGQDQRAAYERTAGWGQGRSDSREDWQSDDRGRPMHMPGQNREARRQEGRRGRWQREELKAREIMTRNPRSVRRNQTLRDAAQIMRDENVGIVPVVDDQNRLIGLLTDRDIVVRAMMEGRNPQDMRVEEIMSDDVHAVHPEERVVDVVELMGDKQIRRVPVVDRQDQLVGIIAMADIATRADTDDKLQEALEDISMKRSFWSNWFK